MKRFKSVFLALAALILFSAPSQAADNIEEEALYVWRGIKVSEPRYLELRSFEMNPPGRNDAVLLGGITLHSARWAEIFPKAPVRNFADRSSSVRYQQLRAKQITEAAPEKIFVLSGDSGALHAEYTMRDLSLLKDMLVDIRMRSPRSKIFVLTFHALPKNRGGVTARQFNAKLRVLVRNMNVQLLDLEKAIDDARADDRGVLVFQNGMLGPTGYAVLAELLAPHIGVCRICR